MSNDRPPGYPFPDDDIVYCSAHADFDPDANSYVALARLPDDHTVSINGKTHRNTHRLVIHTPTKGPVCFLTTANDAQAFLSTALVLLAEDGDRNGGRGVAGVHAPFYERKTGVDIAVSGLDDE